MAETLLERQEGPDRATTSVDPPASRRSWGPGLAVGAVVFALVLVLRVAGLVVGPVAALLALACFFFLPGPQRVSNRFLLFFALQFGWLPLFGWFPGILTSVDLPGVLLAGATGLAAGYQARRRGPLRRRTPRWRATEITAVVLGVGSSLWWALPVLRLGTTGRLRFLFIGWDNSTHLDMLRQNVVLGSFIGVKKHLPGGGLRQSWDYPQGIYQAWAQIVRLWSPHGNPNGGWIVNAFCAVLLVTLGATVVLGCMSIARVSRDQLWAAFPAMGIVLALVVVGRFWIFNGYANFTVAVVTTAAAVTLAWRPTMSRVANFTAVAGLAMLAAYTWYPLFLLTAPALLLAAWPLVEGRRSPLVVPALALTAVALVAPIALFGHRGISNLTSGAQVVNAIYTPGTPWGLTVMSILGLLVLAAVRQVRTPHWPRTLVLASPAVLGALGIGYLSEEAIATSKHITYYGQKFASGVFAVCLLVLVTAAVAALVENRLRPRFSNALLGVISCAVFVGALQFDGYVGPQSNATGTPAAGVGQNQALRTDLRTSAFTRDLLRAAAFARHRDVHGHWFYIAAAPYLVCAQAEEWFAVIEGNPSTKDYSLSFYIPCDPYTGVINTSKMVSWIEQQWPDPTTNDLHMFMPRAVAQALTSDDPSWNVPGTLFLLEHGHVRPFVSS